MVFRTSASGPLEAQSHTYGDRMHLAALFALAFLTPAAADDDGSAEVTPRVFVHIRPEARVNPNFIANQNDGLYSVTQSLKAGLGIKRGIFEGVVDFQGTNGWGNRASSVSTAPEAYLQQGYLQINSGKNWVRFGRQEVHLQNGWHMSAAPWNMAGRTFDGVRTHLQSGAWELDAFSVVLRAPNPEMELPSPTDAGTLPIEQSLGATLAGLATAWQVSDDVSVESLTLAQFEGPSEAEPEQQLWWVTPGLRLFTTPGQTRVDLMLLGQIGDDTGTPIRSYSAMMRARQGLGDTAMKPGVGIIVEQNSGHACTSDPSAGVCETDVIQDFQTGFGRNHYLRGTADQFRGTNLRDLGLTADSTLWQGGKKKSIQTTIEAHFFQMVNPEGVWLTAFGGVQGTGWEVGNTDPNLAWEVDAIVDVWASKVAHIDAGLCFVQPIGVGERITGPDPMTYAFARNRFSF